jgi:hypothetical protein
MQAAATLAYPSGVVADGFAGQRSTIAGGRSGASTSSMLSLSPLVFMVPLARGVMGEDWDTVPPGASRPRGAFAAQTGADLLGGCWQRAGGVAVGTLRHDVSDHVR